MKTDHPPAVSTPFDVHWGGAPIPGESPAGGDLEGDSSFDLIETEITRLESVHDTPPDWPRLAADGVLLLQEKSKHLRLACYVCRASLDVGGLAAFARCLNELASMIATHWSDLHPQGKRMRSKVSPLLWLRDKSVLRLRSWPDDREKTAPVLQALTILEGVLASVTEPELRPDFDVLRSCLQTIGGDAQPSSMSAASTTGGLASASPTSFGTSSSPTEEVASLPFEAEPPKDVFNERSVRTALAETAHRMRAVEIANPLYYRLSREAAWRSVRDAPPLMPDGLTAIRPPPAERLADYERMLAAGDCATLIHQAENTFINCPFWLDGQRLIGCALEQLKAEQAHRAVIEETQHFLDRAPYALELKFSSGTSFAPEAFLHWLARSRPAPARETSAQTPADYGPLQDALERNDVAQLVHAANALLVTNVSPREHFLRIMAIGEAFIAAGLFSLAHPLLERLETDYRRLGLSSWEPALGTELDELLHAVHERDIPFTLPQSRQNSGVSAESSPLPSGDAEHPSFT